MQYTSAEANKLLKKLNEEKVLLNNDFRNKHSFIAAVEENVEDVRPEFNLTEYFEKLEKLNSDIQKVKHAINVFNTSNTIMGMTIDTALVYIPMLSEEKRILSGLAMGQEKERVKESYGRTSTHIEYKYANYSISEAKDRLKKVTTELSDLQLSLDCINNQEKFDIDVEL